MVKIGYKLGSEKYGPLDLLKYAKMAEDAGFNFEMISDHFHPWINKQGNSPFVWATIGGLSQVTQNIPILTGVTCPTFRIHPAIIAQAAATAASMLPGRFILGVGSGENLNEHILGDEWPSTPIRIEMLEEAIDIIRMLWEGDEKLQDYDGFYYNVENARIYTKPNQLPPIYIAAEGDMACYLAGKMGDGLIAQSSDKNVVDKFKASGGNDKPCYGEAVVCWAENEDEAKKQAYQIWPIKANTVQLNADLQTPTHFEQLAGMINEDALTQQMVTGNNSAEFIDEIHNYIDSGFTHVCINHVGKNQEEFIQFCKDKILPEFKD